MKVQSQLAAAHVPQAAGIEYLPLYPPQVSMLFAPLAHFSYAHALAVWWIACPRSSILYVATGSGGPARISASRRDSCYSRRRIPCIFSSHRMGTNIRPCLLCFTAMYMCLRGQRDFLAGIVLGCLAFKPQLALGRRHYFIAAGSAEVSALAPRSAG